MTVQLHELSSKSQLNKFINLPWQIYKEDKAWVPPLKLSVKELFKADHPFYETSDTKSWIAQREGKTVGRIMAIVNHAYNKFHDDNVGFFGFFESVDNDVAKQLISTAEMWLKAKRVSKIIGPVSPSTNYECGLLVEGFQDPPQVMMTYNPKNYLDLFETCGYRKAKDLLAYKCDSSIGAPDKIKRIGDRVMARKNITFRTINMKNFNRDIEIMHEIYNDAWEKNWGFVPMTKAEFLHTAKDMKQVLDPNLIIFVQLDGQDVGFTIALPDLNQVFKEIPSGKLLPFGIFKLLRAKKYMNRCRVLTLGLKKKYRKQGLETLLYLRLFDETVKQGYPEVEASWILEDNIEMNKPIQLMGGVPYKRYRIFEKDL